MVFINNSDSITPVQLLLLYMTAVGIKNHVFAITPLILTAGRDAWMSVIITMVVVVLWIPLLLFIQKQTDNQPLFTWLESVIGAVLTKIIAILFIFYLIIMCSVSLRETISWAGIAYLPATPPLVLIIIFLITCLLLVNTNFRTINMLNVFLLFFILIFGFFVSIANIQHKNYELLRPYLEHGITPVLKAMIYQGSGLSEMFLFLILQHRISKPLTFRYYFLTALILSGLTIGPLMGAIIEFGPVEASLQRFPPFEQWGIVSIGRFLEHVDFLSIYQWLAGVFIRITLLLLVIRELLIFNKKIKESWLLFIAVLIIAILTMIPIEDFKFAKILYFYLLPFTCFFFLSFSIVFGVVACIQGIKKRRVSHEV